MFNHDSQPLHWANRLGFLARRQLADAFAAAGHAVVAEEWAVLLLLWQADGQSPSALADATIRDRTTMTRLLDGMERKGWLQRDMAQGDRRRVQVRLTAQGIALRPQLVPIAEALIARASAGLSADEIAAAAATLRRMTENLMLSKEGER